MESQFREIIRQKIVDALAAPAPALTRRDVRQAMLPEAGMREFLATWQMKRDGTLRGMLEVKP